MASSVACFWAGTVTNAPSFKVVNHDSYPLIFGQVDRFEGLSAERIVARPWAPFQSHYLYLKFAAATTKVIRVACFYRFTPIKQVPLGDNDAATSGHFDKHGCFPSWSWWIQTRFMPDHFWPLLSRFPWRQKNALQTDRPTDGRTDGPTDGQGLL